MNGIPRVSVDQILEESVQDGLVIELVWLPGNETKALNCKQASLRAVTTTFLRKTVRRRKLPQHSWHRDLNPATQNPREAQETVASRTGTTDQFSQSKRAELSALIAPTKIPAY